MFPVFCVECMGNEFETRKEICLKDYDYSSAGAYFVTVCTKERKNHFWDDVGTTNGRPYDKPCGKPDEGVCVQTNRIFGLARTFLRPHNPQP